MRFRICIYLFCDRYCRIFKIFKIDMFCVCYWFMFVIFGFGRKSRRINVSLVYIVLGYGYIIKYFIKVM